ncbi:MAG TPA: lytic transglycosylase domain-containing protein [Nitrospiraceae bacterium]|nr:lytic transglycosylase domain-containing protein [Nitrospiraceae bacterium]
MPATFLLMRIRRCALISIAALAFWQGNVTLQPLPVKAGSKADVYRHVERDGTISFTNVPSDGRFKKIDLDGAGAPRIRLSMGRLEGTIAHHSRRHRLDPALLSAIIKAESDFYPDAVSRAGAIGLMQLMPKTAVHMDIQDPFDPEENIAGGARYIRYLLDRFNGNLPLALAAYNAGATKVEHYATLPPIRETRRYVQKVLRFYRMFGDRRFPEPYTSTPFTSVTWPRTAPVAMAPNP